VAKIALAQTSPAWEQVRENLDSIALFTREASGLGCDMIVFPEMCTTGFTMNPDAAAEVEGGHTESVLVELADRCDIAVVAGTARRKPGADKPNNTAVVFNPDGTPAGMYDKVHLFSPSGEDRRYQAGESVPVFTIGGLRFSVLICYDLRFPELFRSVAPRIDAAVVIANWPASRQEHWRCLLRARAIENQCYAVGVNRVGCDGNGITYAGGSAVYSPDGERVLDAGGGEGLSTATLSPDVVAGWRKAFPALRDAKLLRDVWEPGGTAEDD